MSLVDLIKEWKVTDDPTPYVSIDLSEEDKSIIEQVKTRDPNELFMIELSSVSEEDSPQYIYVITSDGKRIKIHDSMEES